jgi:Domain of unknown function (DUF5753)
MCDRAFPERDGWSSEFYAGSRTWIATPSGFRSWIEHERQARILRIWQLGVLPGLLQTADYASAIRAFRDRDQAVAGGSMEDRITPDL